MRRNKDYMSTRHYFLRSLCCAVWVCYMYYVYLFINLPDMTIGASKVIYFGVNQAIWFALCLLTPENRRSDFSALFNVVLAYVPYFLITYFEGYRTLVSFFVIAAIVVSVIFCLMIFCRKIENKKKNFKVTIDAGKLDGASEAVYDDSVKKPGRKEIRQEKASSRQIRA